ncbi:MAG TPA: TIM-barrel domain-containing protein [Candidatus Baltobacteraceae bacterium]|jgi:alpha-glucosidase (family GH31 glycosyl hydrolase)|nr:TIM-barrel domain-containing protein [Candidatus Baltobacteraceae bacterium]
MTLLACVLAGQLVAQDGRDKLIVRFVAPNVVRVHYEPDGFTSPQTLVLSPHPNFVNVPAACSYDGTAYRLGTPQLRVTVYTHPIRIDVSGNAGTPFLSNGSFSRGSLRFDHDANGNFYGIDGFSLPGSNVDVHQDPRNGVLRFGGRVAANAQGDGGAPLVYTTTYGMLVDSNGGDFSIDGPSLRFSHGSRADVDAFFIAGTPEDVMAAVGAISGTPPMSPKWTLGFLNSQWGTTEPLVRGYVKTYREKQIPLDAFILDFDWKAWGEDDYGEWRWNSTSGAGNVDPDKFPGGASGRFANEMAAQGVRLAGILKPRILLTNSQGEPTQAAAFATSRGFWYPEAPYPDYFSKRLARDIDFSKAGARRWFWQHTLPAYRSGIVGFWNDEADMHDGFAFDNFQFANMERALYEGARSSGNTRVWSLNRNFYLGAQRYAYAEWSGDISFGFDSMLDQSTRMLSTIDLGEVKWSMDTGGFFGTPTPENYARWMQFAAFVPIMRVHCTLGQHRQPWYFGPAAEQVAKRAILLRHTLLPYIYSYDREAYERNVGLVRPLFWEYPNDATDTIPYVNDEWMFGKWLLVAPVFGEGQAHRSVFLPPGTWIDYFRGKQYSGKQWISYRVNPDTWNDVPLFIRAGAIIPTMVPQQYVGEHPVREVTVDVFPSRATSDFEYYDDDGSTYAYESGAYFKQRISAQLTVEGARVTFGAPAGTYKPALAQYVVRIHAPAKTVLVDSTPRRTQITKDRYGAVTVVRVTAGVRHSIVLR